MDWVPAGVTWVAFERWDEAVAWEAGVAVEEAPAAEAEAASAKAAVVAWRTPASNQPQDPALMPLPLCPSQDDRRGKGRTGLLAPGDGGPAMLQIPSTVCQGHIPAILVVMLLLMIYRPETLHGLGKKIVGNAACSFAQVMAGMTVGSHISKSLYYGAGCEWMVSIC